MVRGWPDVRGTIRRWGKPIAREPRRTSWMHEVEDEEHSLQWVQNHNGLDEKGKQCCHNQLEAGTWQWRWAESTWLNVVILAHPRVSLGIPLSTSLCGWCYDNDILMDKTEIVPAPHNYVLAVGTDCDKQWHNILKAMRAEV